MLNAVKSQLVPTCRECLSGKKLIFFFVFVLIVHCTLKIEDCMSQWQPDVRLTNDTAASFTSYNNAWCIASSGSVVHVVWTDTRDGKFQVYYKRSLDAGVNWGADTRLSDNTTSSRAPSIAVSGSVVHVVWYKYISISNNDIYYKRSTDGGVNWEADKSLTIDTSQSDFPSVKISGSIVHVVWEDNRNGDREIYYKRSTDEGVNWGTDIRLTNNVFSSVFSSVAASGSVVHVVWQERRDGTREIYYKRSNDAGVSWGADTRLTNNTAISYLPSVAVSSLPLGSVIHVVWQDLSLIHI